MSRRKKAFIKGKKLPLKQLKSQLITLFSKDKTKRLNAKQVINKLQISNNRESVQYALSKLAEDKVLFNVNDDKYRWDKSATIEAQSKSTLSKRYMGQLDLIRSGAGYVIVEGLENDIYVHEKNLNGAMNKDIVTVRVPKIPGKRKPEGVVINIEKRSTTHVIGRISISNMRI